VGAPQDGRDFQKGDAASLKKEGLISDIRRENCLRYEKGSILKPRKRAEKERGGNIRDYLCSDLRSNKQRVSNNEREIIDVILQYRKKRENENALRYGRQALIRA